MTLAAISMFKQGQRERREEEFDAAIFGLTLVVTVIV